MFAGLHEKCRKSDKPVLKRGAARGSFGGRSLPKSVRATYRWVSVPAASLRTPTWSTDMNRIAIVAQLITLAAGVAISGECRGDPVAAPPPVSVVVLVAGNVWDGLADAALGPMEILVRDGRIAAMGRTVERPAGCRVVDLSKHTVTPGFIDCHVHVTMRPEDEGAIWALAPADKAVLGVQALRVLLDRGFTTVRDLCDMDFGGYTTVSLQRAVEKGLVTGPRMIVAAHLVSTSGGHGDARPLVAAQGYRTGTSRRLHRQAYERVTSTQASRPRASGLSRRRRACLWRP